MDQGERRPVAFVAGAPDEMRGELARRLAREGYALVVASEAEDVSSRDGVERLARRVAELDRAPDAVALHVVIGRGAPTAAADARSQPIDLNVRGAIALARMCLPPMVERGAGRLLLTSVGDDGPSADHLAAFVDRTRSELAGTGVTVAHLVFVSSDDRVGAARAAVAVLSGGRGEPPTSPNGS